MCYLHGQGQIQCFWKGVALYVDVTKKILGFRWSKKAKVRLEIINFWQNISISIFKFSPFLYAIKACQWNLINFPKFASALIRKEKLRKVDLCFILGCFIKSFNMIINRFLVLQANSQPNFCFLISGWNLISARNIKRGSMEWQRARNGKLQYLFQK